MIDITERQDTRPSAAMTINRADFTPSGRSKSLLCLMPYYHFKLFMDAKNGIAP